MSFVAWQTVNIIDLDSVAAMPYFWNYLVTGLGKIRKMLHHIPVAGTYSYVGLSTLHRGAEQSV